ncbi:zinc finger protein ZPR1 isoform X2 [Erpetoichthys calabaricus]|uniref:zinc finger protein ZPR1 isoform X2 n=1 Tax=Erpetoichthys calabaricus TaxID=27687 RepID=UPI002234CB62|nr:zinc finger protein ZPR1 isoform X2 [Erpetoichthys calabaricus]
MSVIGEEEVRGCKAVFKAISADDQEQQPTEIESLCMNCYKNGTTRLLLTKIPFFKEIIISSFTCDQCGWTNSEIQSAGKIQDQGVLYCLHIQSRKDLNREVVKADSATTKIPELDFEIPAFSQKGALSTVEGLIDRAIAGLEQDQPLRKENDPEVALKIEEFIDKLKQLKDVEKPFTLIIDDPSGNSFVENPFAPRADEVLSVTHYERNAQQNLQLGIKVGINVEQEQLGNKIEDMRNEVLQFNTNCPECNAPASTNMKLVQIPHFKEVIIMATTCDVCGHRTNEVKSGGATEEHGTRITLHVTDVTDMSRDLLKSETCRILIPELDFELGMAALGGKFTTLEGLLKDIKDLIVEKNPFTAGDSCTKDKVEKLQAFGKNIDKILNGQMDVHIILDDSAGNSYLQNLYAPDDDPEMKIEKYERTYEQNEELGLNDMKTEGYQEDNNVD